jgi:AcrR family transcriptional regulator
MSSERGARTKQAILDAATELFATGGSRGTGLIAIGERAGVSHSAVLYHFGSAEALLMAVLDERLRRFADATAAAWGNGGIEVIANLPEVGRFNGANPGLTKLFVVLKAEALEPSAPTHQYFVRHRRRTARAYQKAIEQAMAEGDFRPDLDARAHADDITAFIGGAEADWLLDPKQTDLVQMYERYARHLLSILSTP